MSKRLTRIFTPDIQASLPGILQKQIHVVLRNGHTVFGYIQSNNNISLIVKDLRNHLHEIPLKDVQEIILDHRDAFTNSFAEF